MIGSIGSSGSFTNIYSRDAQLGPNVPGAVARPSDNVSGPDPRPGMSDSSADRENRRLMALLTPDDWAVVSASVGYKCGPDETGYVGGPQPALAISIAYDRDFGCLQGPLTSNYLKNLGANQPADLANQVGNALDFLQRKHRDDDVDRAQRPRIDVLA